MEVAGTRLSPQLEALLARFRFDRVPFEELRARLVAAAPDPESLHRITEQIEVPAEDVAHRLPSSGTAERERAAARGSEAIGRGEVAAVVLAGGMATRFGSQVKALASVLEGRELSFLDLKLADLSRLGVDITLMTSFATHDALLEAVRRHRLSSSPRSSCRCGCRQTARSSSTATARPPRMHPGTATSPMRCSSRARSSATAAPACARSSCATSTTSGRRSTRRSPASTANSAARSRRSSSPSCPGDAGGLPVRRADGSLAIAEAFRVPEGFPHEQFPLFNTNTLWIDVAALEAPAEFTWCVARKSVDDREAIQFERLVGELTWWHPSRYVHVPREGAASRFVPVKDEDDLAAAQEQIAAICRERLALDV